MRHSISTRLAELVYGGVMGCFAIIHFTNADTMSGLLPDFMPGDGRIWVFITGSVFMAAALAIIFNKLKALACYLLAAMLLVFVFSLHLQPAMDGNPGQLLKDTGLAMGAIIIGGRHPGRRVAVNS